MSKIITGIVVSAKMKNAAVIEVGRTVINSKYHKQMKRTTRLKAKIIREVKEGDKVLIREIKPVSKDIAWEIVTDNVKDKHGTA